MFKKLIKRPKMWVRFWLPSITAALLLWISFPPLRIPGAIFLGWLPLLRLLQEDLDRDSSAKSAKVGRKFWAGGFLFYGGLFYWILNLSNEQVTIPGLMIPCLIFMAAYLGLFYLVLAWILRRTAIGTKLPLGLLFPIFLTLIEWLKSIGPLALPWGIPGYALARLPEAFQFTAFTGFWGLTFWIGLVTGLLHEGLRFGPRPGAQFVRPTRRRWMMITLAVLVLAVPFIHGSLRLNSAPPPGTALKGNGGCRVGIIQPNVIREVKWRPGGAQASWERLNRVSRQAMEEGADLLIWPETALPLRLMYQPLYMARIRNLLAEGGLPLLTGTLHTELDTLTQRQRPRNSALYIAADGEILGLYHKRKLVPFSERMPMQKVLPFLTQLDFGQSDFAPGETWPLFETGLLRMAPLICFESVFPEVSRRFVKEGANVLVNITNDFWFGDSPGPVQHADMSIHRAVETGLPLIRCANTGFSFFVDPYGRIVQSLGTFEEGMLLSEVGPGRPSFAMRTGPWFLYALIVIGVGLFISSILFSRKRRGRHG